MAITDSDRLLGAGRKITFLDGSEHVVRFDYLGIKRLEDDFGGVLDAAEEVKTRQFGATARMIAAGTGFPMDDALLTMLDPKRVNDYIEAVFGALNEGLGIGDSPAVEEASVADPPSAEANGSSLGPTTTTLPQFALAGAPPTSGS